MKLISDPEVANVFDSYPKNINSKLNYLRDLIIETANELDDVKELHETLKWGEPSYIAKNGSTLRIDWKEKSPQKYSMYFKCTSKLVESFKNVYGDLFKYEKNRAIYFHLDDKVPKNELKKCIKATLTYHQVKKVENLGL